MVLDALEATDGLLELAARLAVGEGHVEHASQAAHLVCREQRRCSRQDTVKHRPALLRTGAKQGILIDADTVQPHFCKTGREPGYGPDGDAYSLRFDQEQAYKPRLQASGHHQIRRIHRVMDEKLRARERVAAARSPRGGVHLFGAPTVVLLGDRGGEHPRAIGDGRQQRSLLLGRTSFQDGQGREHGGREVRSGHRAPAELLEHHARVHERSPCTAQLLRNQAAEETRAHQARPRCADDGRPACIDIHELRLGELAVD